MIAHLGLFLHIPSTRELPGNVPLCPAASVRIFLTPSTKIWRCGKGWSVISEGGYLNLCLLWEVTCWHHSGRQYGPRVACYGTCYFHFHETWTICSRKIRCELINGSNLHRLASMCMFFEWNLDLVRRTERKPLESWIISNVLMKTVRVVPKTGNRVAILTWFWLKKWWNHAILKINQF